LVHPLAGERVFEVGSNCDRIERVNGGYEVIRGSALFRLSASRVDYFHQDPRPGFEIERANAARELPTYAKAEKDGTFSCTLCAANLRTVHALRVHHGRSHGDGGSEDNDERWP